MLLIFNFDQLLSPFFTHSFFRNFETLVNVLAVLLKFYLHDVALLNLSVFGNYSEVRLSFICAGIVSRVLKDLRRSERQDLTLERKAYQSLRRGLENKDSLLSDSVHDEEIVYVLESLARSILVPRLCIKGLIFERPFNQVSLPKPVFAGYLLLCFDQL